MLLAPTAVGAYGRVAVVLDPQGAPLGLAGVTGTLPAEPAQPPLNRFFWMEHLAKDGPAALTFYKGLAGYESSVTASEHGIDYNVLKRQRSRAGLLQLPRSSRESSRTGCPTSGWRTRPLSRRRRSRSAGRW